MDIITNIDQAITAHGKWKFRLIQAIHNGTTDFLVDIVKVDDQCEFGKWLYSLPANTRAMLQWKKIQDLHAIFHATAARVLLDATSGHRDRAINEMRSEGSFSRDSANLVIELLRWKNTSK